MTPMTRKPTPTAWEILRNSRLSAVMRLVDDSLSEQCLVRKRRSGEKMGCGGGKGHGGFMAFCLGRNCNSSRRGNNISGRSEPTKRTGRRTLGASVDELSAVLEELAGHLSKIFELVGHGCDGCVGVRCAVKVFIRECGG